MDYLHDLISSDMGPEYIPQLPKVPSIDTSHFGLGDIGPSQPVEPSVPTDPFADLHALADRPKSEGQNLVRRFEGDISRFTQDKHFNQMGYDPEAAYVKGGEKMYDPNEIRYQKVQTWGDVMGNAMGQFANLTWNSFKNSAISDGHMLNAIFNPLSWSNFHEKFMGSPDELLAADKEQKAIMNKYAIFSSPDTDNTIFNKEMLGNMTGQLGFSVGTGLYMAAQTLLTAGMADAFSAVGRGKDLVRMGKLMEAAGVLGKGEEAATIMQNFNRGARTAETISQAKKDLMALGDLAKNRGAMEEAWNSVKQMLVPGRQIYTDAKAARIAGATWGQAASAGVPGLIKTYTMFNAARSEASMEAAGTYGQLYMDLLDNYEKEHGEPAMGKDAEDIKRAAYGAATDNYIVNTGLLMMMNEMEFGGMLNKFSSSKRLLRQAAEAAESGEAAKMFEVTGKVKRDIGKIKAGTEGTVAYDKGMLGAWSKFGSMRKDFGLGTALWQGVKASQKKALKFELGEGIQEILQSTSDETFRDYYKNLYNGNKDLDGGFLTDFRDANWSKGLTTQMNMDGWKTFLMGATTGLFLSPLTASGMYLHEKGMSSINDEYKGQLAAAKKVTKANVDILNAVHQDPEKAMNEHMGAWKSTTKATNNMKGALVEDDEYEYSNSRTDILTKAAATAIKTGTLDSLLTSLRSLDDGRFANEAEMRQALNLPDTGGKGPKEVLHSVIKKIEGYNVKYQSLNDSFAGMIMPELSTDPNDYINNIVKKKALKDAIEILATTSHHADDAIERSQAIKQELASLPGIGASASAAFEIMGSKKELANTVRQLRETARNSSNLQDAESSQLSRQATEQANLLEAWGEAFEKHQKMKNATSEEQNAVGFRQEFAAMGAKLKSKFHEYLEAHNEANNGPKITSDVNMNKAFKLLGDYHQLNEDLGQYVEAFNVLSDPHTFRALHFKIADGMQHAQQDIKNETAEGIKSRAKQSHDNTSTDEDITTDEETTQGEEAAGAEEGGEEGKKGNQPGGKKAGTTKQPEGKIELENAEEIRDNIIAHHTGRLDKNAKKVALTPEAKAFYDSKPGLQKRVNFIDSLSVSDASKVDYAKPGRIAQELKDAITTWFNEKVESVTPEEGEGAGKGPEVKGRKQVERALSDMRAAKTTIDALNAISILEGNLKIAPDAITPEEQKEVDAVKQKAADEGYEVREKATLVVGDKVQTENPTNYGDAGGPISKEAAEKLDALIKLRESRGIEVESNDLKVVSRTIKPEIIKDGVMVQAGQYNTIIFTTVAEAKAAIQEALGTTEEEGVPETTEYKTKATKKDDQVRIHPFQEFALRDTLKAVKNADGKFEIQDTLNGNVVVATVATEAEVYDQVGEIIKDRAREALSTLLRNTPKDVLIDGMSLVITPNTAFTDEGPTYPLGDNPHVTQNRYPFKLEIRFTGEDGNTRTIAFLTAPNLYSYRFNGKAVDIAAMTPDQFEKVFSVGDGNAATMLAAWQSDAVIANALGVKITALLDAGITSLSGAELAAHLGVEVTRGEYDWADKLAMPSLAEVEGTGATILSVQDKGGNPLIPGTEDKLPDVPADVRSDVRAAIQLPNGNIHWVEVQGERGAAVEPLVTAVSEAVKTFYDKDSTEEQRAAARKVIDEQGGLIFSALPPGHPLKGVKIYLNNKGKDSTLFADFYMKSKKDWENYFLSQVADQNDEKAVAKAMKLAEEAAVYTTYIDKGDGTTKPVSGYATLGRFSDLDSLAAALNKAVNSLLPKRMEERTGKVIKPEIFKKKFAINLGPQNLSVQGSTNPTPEKVMAMQTTTTPRVVKNAYLTYTVVDGSIPAETEPAVPSDVAEEPSVNGYGQTKQQPSPIPDTGVQSTEEVVAERDAQILETMDDNAGMADLIAMTQGTGVSEPIREYVEYEEGEEDEIPIVEEESPFKILSVEGFTDHSVVNIDAFKQWAELNLPKWMVIEDLGNLTGNLQDKSVVIGKFLAHLKTIQVYRNTPFKYHEAFHAVMRLLLPEAQVEQLIADARKASGMTPQKLAAFKKEHASYRRMSDEQLKDLYAEEWMADEFDKFMDKKPTKAPKGIKGWFQKLADWIKEVFSCLSGRRMQSLFYEINRGKYRNAHIQDNRFNNTGLNMSEPVMKLVGIEKVYVKDSNGKLVPVMRSLPQHIGEVLSCTLSAQFHEFKKTLPQLSKNDLLEHILDMYKAMYDLNRPEYDAQLKALRGQAKLSHFNKLRDLNTIFNSETAREILKESTDVHLQLMGYRQELDEDLAEGQEARDGIRTTSDFDKSDDMFGGMNSLAKLLREFIGSTTEPYVDEFQNSAFMMSPYATAGTPLVQAVSAAHIYNGMLKLLANSSSDEQLIARMQYYENNGNNKATIAFIQRIKRETGFRKEADGTWTVTQNPTLFQQVIKGLNNYDTNPMFVDMKPKGAVKIYSPNRQDSARVQFEAWNTAFENIFMPKFNIPGEVKQQAIKEATAPLTELRKLMAAGFHNTRVEDGPLTDIVAKAVNELRRVTGINWHINYLEYCVAANKSLEARTPNQQQTFLAHQGTYAMDTEDIDGIKIALKGGNIFRKSEDLTEGAASRLLKIAAGNAQFDETIDSMTYTDPEGKVRYSSQKPNYYMVRVRQLNSSDLRKELEKSPGHNNWLLQDTDFKFMGDNGLLRTASLSGMKVRDDIEANEAEINENFSGSLEETGKAVAYKGFTERDVQVNLLSLAGANNKIQSGPNKHQSFYVTPHLLTVVEAKSTGYAVSLPVTEAYGTKGITADTIDKLYQMVEQEVAMIKQTRVEIDNGTGKESGYHTGKQNPDGTWKEAPRGLRLFNTKMWFSKEVREAIESGAENDPNYELSPEDIKRLIKNYWEGRIQNYFNYLQDLGIIGGRDKGGKMINKLLPAFFEEGFKDDDRDKKMNMRVGDLAHNLAQVFMNDVINTSALRQLMHGNEAHSFKNNIDRIKRAAGGNAAGMSASFNFTAPSLGIDHTFTKFHHFTYKDPVYTKMSGSEGEKADGQLYCTEKGLRYALFGFGKLTKVQAVILDKLKMGDTVTEKEVLGAGGLKEHGMFNSLKVTYYDDNNVYLKCSMTPIFREEVSIWDGTTWQPKITAKDKHALLDKMEEYEKRKGTVVYAGPASHSKGLKRNVANTVGEVNDSHFEELGTQWFRLQMENPSNKVTQTDPTQNKQQLLSEQVKATKVMYKGAPTSVGAVMDHYLRDTSTRLNNNYQDAANSMFKLQEGLITLEKDIKSGQVTPELGMFFQEVRKQLEATGADQQTLDMLEVDGNGKPVYDLNHPGTLQKYTQLFFAHFSKAMAEKQPGLTLALVSDWGVQRVKEVLSIYPPGHELAGQPRTWRVVTDAEYTKNPAKYADAKKFDNEHDRKFYNIKDGDYIVDDLRHNVPEFDADGNIIGRYTEYIRPAHWGAEMNGLVDALIKGYGIRIPSDDKHQYVSLRMVDTMPVVMGSVGVFPQELMEISGSDFDIDKLFIQLNDIFFKKGGVVEAFGGATEPDEMFDEYKVWTKKNNKIYRSKLEDLKANDEYYQIAKKKVDEIKANIREFQTQIDDLNWIADDDTDPYAGLFKQTKRELAETLKNLSEEEREDIESLKEVVEMLEREALDYLRLPSTTSAYMKLKDAGKEPNNGILNNNILAAKIALLSNEHISGGGKFAIINQGTSTKVLDDLVKELTGEGMIPEEPEVEINGMHGKGISYINNQEGKRNIGAAINAMLAFSLMEQYGHVLEDKFGIDYNKQTYKSFADSLTTDGVRKFNQISAIVNAMTDNAKERLAAKLGLNITAVGMTTTMVALGIPIKDAVLFQLQPVMKEYYRRIANRNSVLQNFGDNMPPKKIMKELLETYGNLVRAKYNLKENEAWPEEVSEKFNIKQEDLIENIRSGGSDPVLQFAVLRQMAKVKTLSDTMGTISSIMKLNQGMDVSWEESDATEEKLVELGIKNGERDPTADLLGTEFPIDVRDILLNQHHIMSTYIKMFTQIRELAKGIFLERTDLFEEMTNKVMNNMDTTFKDPEGKFKKKIKDDLISFLTIKAYLKWLKGDESTGTPERAGTLSTLTHALIYPSQKAKMGPEFEDIADVITRLRKTSKNYLVKKFLRLILAEQEGNKSKINKAEGNSWARLSENEQQRLYDSFIELYSSNKTHKDAEILFNYLLVKDGGQFKSGSFIKYIPVFAFKDMLDRTKEITQSMAAGEVDYQALYGTSKEDLTQQFLMSEATHISNQKFVPEIETDRDSRIKLTSSKLVLPKSQPDSYMAPVVKVSKKLYVLSDNKEDEAIYLNEPWRGSPGQWSGAGVFGEVPSLYTVGKRKPQNENVDNPGYSPDAPESEQDTVHTVELPGPIEIALTGSHADTLLKNFNIGSWTDGSYIYYVDQTEGSETNGFVLEAYDNLTPEQVLNRLGVTIPEVAPEGTEEEGVTTETKEPIPPTRVERRYTPEKVTELAPNQIFVFGSNPKGINGNTVNNTGGAALVATKNGWVEQGEKMDNKLSESGKAWGVVTIKNPGDKRSQPLQEIGKGLQTMLLAAKANPQKEFLVTKLGSNLAGYTVPEIKGLFEKLHEKNLIPDNVILPQEYEVRDTATKAATPGVSSHSATAMSEEQWDAVIAETNKARPSVSPEAWSKRIKTYRDSMRMSMTDEQIVNKIKECL